MYRLLCSTSVHAHSVIPRVYTLLVIAIYLELHQPVHYVAASVFHVSACAVLVKITGWFRIKPVGTCEIKNLGLLYLIKEVAMLR